MNRFGTFKEAEINTQIEKTTLANTKKNKKFVWNQFMDFCATRGYKLERETPVCEIAKILKDWAHNMKEMGKIKKQVVHANRLKPYKGMDLYEKKQKLVEDAKKTEKVVEEGQKEDETSEIAYVLTPEEFDKQLKFHNAQAQSNIEEININYSVEENIISEPEL
ncbi:hypothetical protein JTB14_020522 [Gonioctena quinquepunctata]|nr:hypothetical protein JTB14_020522 [Gonioctena quinquepunctata]